MSENPGSLLAAYDAFMRGDKLSPEQNELQRKVMLAGAFAARAYQMGHCEGQATHALTRSFLIALMDENSEELDYLRQCPSAGEVARQANDQLQRIARGSPHD